MRPTTLAALTLATFALAACGGEQPAPQPPPPPPPPAAMTSAVAPAPPADTTPPPPKPTLAELIPQALQAMGEAWQRRDMPKFLSNFSDDVVDSVYGIGEFRKDDFAKQIGALMDMSKDIKSRPARVWIKANVAVSELVTAGTMTGDFMGMKANGRPFGGYRVIVMWFNDDGKAKLVHEYADMAGMMAQLQGKKDAPPVPAVPTNPPEVHVARGTPDEDKLADWGKAGDDAMSKDDTKAAMATMADDGDYWLNMGGPAMKGKALDKGFADWFKAFPDQKWTVTNAWGIDGFAILEHTMNGTNKGKFGPMPATGKSVSNWHWIDIQQPNATGKIQHGWGYTNLVEAFAQLGAIKQPGEAPKGAAPKAPPPPKNPFAPKKTK